MNQEDGNFREYLNLVIDEIAAEMTGQDVAAFVITKAQVWKKDEESDGEAIFRELTEAFDAEIAKKKVLKADISSLRRDLEEAEEILMFYANEQNWQTQGHPQIDAHDYPVNHDRGSRARSFLNREKDNG